MWQLEINDDIADITISHFHLNFLQSHSTTTKSHWIIIFSRWNHVSTPLNPRQISLSPPQNRLLPRPLVQPLPTIREEGLTATPSPPGPRAMLPESGSQGLGYRRRYVCRILQLHNILWRITCFIFLNICIYTNTHTHVYIYTDMYIYIHGCLSKFRRHVNRM